MRLDVGEHRRGEGCHHLHHGIYFLSLIGHDGSRAEDYDGIIMRREDWLVNLMPPDDRETDIGILRQESREEAFGGVGVVDIDLAVEKTIVHGNAIGNPVIADDR